MASEVPSVQTPASSLTHGSQAPTQVLVQKSGNTLPQDGKVTATASAAQPSVGQQPQPSRIAAAQQQAESAQQTKQAKQKQQAEQQQDPKAQKADLASQVATVNKYLNDTGRAAQFRASSNEKMIEEVNPATGEVVAQYSAQVFEALARSVGITGEAVVDEHA
jgi:uncharacterized FlaG/YvyC family protein